MKILSKQAKNHFDQPHFNLSYDPGWKRQEIMRIKSTNIKYEKQVEE